MKKRFGIVILLCLLFTLVAVSSASAAPTGTTVISNELSGTVDVLAQEATWSETSHYGTHDGTVYKEFELLDSSSNSISLAAGNVSSISVTGPDGTKTLTPDTDTTLWFNVAKPSGDYVYTIVIDDTTTYTATLAWTKMNILNIGWNLPATGTRTVNETFEVETTAQLNSALTGVTEVGRVLYIIEVMKSNGTPADTNDVTAVASDGQTLGYNTTGGFFYWGPPEGFTFSGTDTVTTTFNTTIKTPGTYTIKAYAVQLP